MPDTRDPFKLLSTTESNIAIKDISVLFDFSLPLGGERQDAPHTYQPNDALNSSFLANTLYATVPSPLQGSIKKPEEKNQERPQDKLRSKQKESFHEEQGQLLPPGISEIRNRIRADLNLLAPEKQRVLLLEILSDLNSRPEESGESRRGAEETGEAIITDSEELSKSEIGFPKRPCHSKPAMESISPASLDQPPLRLPEPDDGTYMKYSDYVQECQGNKISRNERMSGEEFLRKYWGKYLDAGILFLPDLRKLDNSLVNKLDNDGRKVEKTAADFVPDVGERGKSMAKNINPEALREAYRIIQQAWRYGISIKDQG